MRQDITLVIGNKNYSSWSLRAWLALERTGAPFEEIVHDVDDPAARERIRKVSPSGKVPCLRHGDIIVWDSLAIGEYLAETFRGAKLWPGDHIARAIARSACAEMHSGFQSLRTNMPMNIRRSAPGVGRGPGVDEDIARISSLWREMRARFAKDSGPFLCGPFTLVDAFYAPVVTRFRTYGVELHPEADAYCDAIMAHPAMKTWCAAAVDEPLAIAKYDELGK